MAEQKSGPAAVARGPAGGGSEETRQPRTLEEALGRLELLAASRGQLVVTDGGVDLKLTVERNVAELEVDGAGLPAATAAADKAIIRAFVQAYFWSNVALDLLSGRAIGTAADEPVSERPRLRVERPDAGRELCRAIADEAARLEPLRRKVPSLRVVVGSTATTRAAKAGDAVTVKLRTAIVAKGEVPILDWARAENVELSDATSSLADLLDANEARIVRKLEASTSAAKPAATGLGGFVPGLRQERLARSLQGREDGLAAKTWRRAGWGRLSRGRVAEAVSDFGQALSTDAGRAAEQGMEAREGLLAALEAQAEATRRGGQEPDAALVAESKRVAGELGHAYLELGLMNRARLALERSLDAGAPPTAQLELVDALLGAGQLVRAIERAESLAPRLDRDARRALALRIVQAGAKGPSLDRALALAGAMKERSAVRGLLVGGVVALVAGGLLAVHASAVSAFEAASSDVARRLPGEGPSEKLAEPLRDVAARFGFDPVAATATARADHLSDLAKDSALLEANRSVLRWRSAADALAARARLDELLKAARTPALQGIFRTSIARFDAWAKEVNVEVEKLRTAVQQSDAPGSLDCATSLVAQYPSWRSLWKDVSIPLRIKPSPADALISWNGSLLTDGNSLVLVPLEGGAGNLHVDAPGYVAVDRRVTLLDAPVLNVSLERRASTTPEPRHTPAPPLAPQTTTPTRPTATASPAPVGPVTPRPRIKIFGGDPPPRGDGADGSSGENAPARVAEPEKFSVRDASEADLAKLVGAKTIIDPTPGYFDYLKPLIQKRFRLMVEIVTTVREKQVFLDGVKLHLTDVALGKPIPVRFVELDKPCERPLRGLEGGVGWKVEVLSRTLHLDAAKLRSDLEDELNSAMADFTKREQDSGK